MKDKIYDLIDEAAYFMDKLRITRRIGFYFTLWITFHAFQSSIELATSIGDPIGAAAIIAAIMVPISALQGFALNFHHKHAERPNRESKAEEGEA